MHLLPTIATVIATTACLATASSQSRNPLQVLGVVDNPSINTPSHRVNALSSFDLTFDLYKELRIRLSLEPNHDILPDEGVHVNYLGADGTVARTEVIERLDHKVFKGSSWVQNEDLAWERVGWSRIVIRRDGMHPLFEGAFTINHDHHHIQLRSNYMQTKHALDPDLEYSDDEYMVLFRDSDIADGAHTELKRDLKSDLSCQSDELEFNLNPDHPVYNNVFTPSEGVWGVMPVGSMFGKRQLDTQPGGNSAGVNLASTIGQTNGCPNTRKVALVGVATDCTYTATFNSTESARQNIITQMNTASDIYESTFNISLGLQNLTISDANCPGSPPAATPWNQPCSNNVNIQDRLNLFSAWRGGEQDTNSHWTLLSTCNTGSAVGLAWLGQACVNTLSKVNSSSGVTESVSGANVVVRTSTEWQVIAHETGHTFGAVHDCTAQTCANSNTVSAQQCCPLSSISCNAGERFIMNPSTTQGIKAFSPCSIGNICSAMLRNSVKTTCLAPNRGVTTITGQQCGNGIVEAGEDCDCGGVQSCGNNPCCDPTTCKFKNSAVCDDSNEDCCQNCQFAASGTVCRGSTGVCDPQEVCPGNSPTCPADVTTPDGTDCSIAGSNEKNLKCTSGQCTSRDLQCKTVMGSYTRGNDTNACDTNSCMLSCRSPEFGPNVCYGLQQNFLDGTTCAGNGKCVNGACKGASWTGQVRSWIESHKELVIGLAVGIGVLILFVLGSCVGRCVRRARGGRNKRKGGREYAQSRHTSSRGGAPQQRQQQQMYQRPNAGGEWYGVGGPGGGMYSGWEGNGRGGRREEAWIGPMPPAYFGRPGHGQAYGSHGGSSVRYA